MKKKFLLVPLLVLIFTLIPASFLNADIVNLVKNGAFSTGSDGLDDWVIDIGTASAIEGNVYLNNTFIYQVINSSNKNLTFSCDLFPIKNENLFVFVEFWKGSFYLGGPVYYFSTIPLNDWSKVSFKISDLWLNFYGTDLPDFTEIHLAFGGNHAEGFFDNIKLTYSKETSNEFSIRNQLTWVKF